MMQQKRFTVYRWENWIEHLNGRGQEVSKQFNVKSIKR